MKPEPLRPIHCVGFFLYAFGHVTDGEKEQIIKQLKIWSPEPVCPDFNALVTEIVDWYVDVYDSGQSEMQKMVWYCAGSIKDFFNSQPSGGASIVKKQFVDALVEIAKVDGEIKESEKAWLNAICEIFEVDVPTI